MILQELPRLTYYQMRIKQVQLLTKLDTFCSKEITNIIMNSDINQKEKITQLRYYLLCNHKTEDEVNELLQKLL